MAIALFSEIVKCFFFFVFINNCQFWCFLLFLFKPNIIVTLWILRGERGVSRSLATPQNCRTLHRMFQIDMTAWAWRESQSYLFSLIEITEIIPSKWLFPKTNKFSLTNRLKNLCCAKSYTGEKVNKWATIHIQPIKNRKTLRQRLLSAI